MLVDDRRIRVLNRDFRGKDESTDVLSFPQLDEATDDATAILSLPQFEEAMDDVASGRGRARRRSARPRPDEAAAQALTRARSARVNACAAIYARGRAAGDSRPPLALGDVVISVDTVRRQAHALGVTTAVRIRTLLIHGLLHLLGYDHERSPAEARRQFARERELAACLAEAQEQPPPLPAAAAPARGASPPAAMPHETAARPKRRTRDDGSR
jgi:probable rRNA maturation factor